MPEPVGDQRAMAALVMNLTGTHGCCCWMAGAAGLGCLHERSGRTLARPTGEVTAFAAIVNGVVPNSPSGCTPYQVGNGSRPAVEKTCGSHLG